MTITRLKICKGDWKYIRCLDSSEVLAGSILTFVQCIEYQNLLSAPEHIHMLTEALMIAISEIQSKNPPDFDENLMSKDLLAKLSMA